MGEWSRETIWRQGHVLTNDACQTLHFSHQDSPERTFVVAISHDCDLAQPPVKEPFVELVVGRAIDVIEADSHAKNPRRLHIEFNGPEGLLAVELSAVHKALVKKEVLAPFGPRTDVSLDAHGLFILQRWLAVRYRRAAFPDEFDRRLNEAKMPRRIEKVLNKAGTHVVAVFFDVDRGEDIKHIGPGDPYSLGIYLVSDTQKNENDAEAAAQSAADDIEKAFEKAFQSEDGKWKNIQLKYCDVMTDQALTFKGSREFKEWRLEHMSLKDDPPQPTLQND
jgi:hypothetical protein